MKIESKTLHWRKWKYESPEQEAEAKKYSKSAFDDYECYLSCSLKKKADRFWGYEAFYYDCQWFEVFGFWFFAVEWSSRLTSKRLWRKHYD